MDTEYKPYVVSFFGHRQIDNFKGAEKALELMAQELIKSKGFVDFQVCREGEFDILAASTIRRAVKELDRGNSTLTLVLPYMKAEYANNRESYGKYFDCVEICGKAEKGHFRGAYRTRNREMILRSDMAIFCIERESGGAYQTYEYADKRAAEELRVENCRILILDPRMNKPRSPVRPYSSLPSKK